MSRPTTPLPSFVPQKEQTHFISPPRSSTHPVKPGHHVPHHPHRVHHHHHHHHRDKSVPQSALQPTISNPFANSLSFGDFLPKTTAIGKIVSGATSQEDIEKKEKQQERQREAEEAEKWEREKAQWREVERLRTKRTAINDDLRTTFTTLSTLSTTTTRRLDYTYYALLSSLSSLTTTIADLHNLSTTTTTFSSHFITSTSSLTSSTDSQINAADRGFKQQARRISELETRMRNGRERMQVLEGRLEDVRLKVERSGERDREGRKAAERRWKMLWGFLGVGGVLVLVLVVVRHWPGFGMDIGRVTSMEGLKREGAMVERGQGRHEGISRSEEAAKTSVHEDPVLKLFDEL